MYVALKPWKGHLGIRMQGQILWGALRIRNGEGGDEEKMVGAREDDEEEEKKRRRERENENSERSRWLKEASLCGEIIVRGFNSINRRSLRPESRRFEAGS